MNRPCRHLAGRLFFRGLDFCSPTTFVVVVAALGFGARPCRFLLSLSSRRRPFQRRSLVRPPCRQKRGFFSFCQREKEKQKDDDDDSFFLLASCLFLGLGEVRGVRTTTKRRPLATAATGDDDLWRTASVSQTVTRKRKRKRKKKGDAPHHRLPPSQKSLTVVTTTHTQSINKPPSIPCGPIRKIHQQKDTQTARPSLGGRRRRPREAHPKTKNNKSTIPTDRLPRRQKEEGRRQRRTQKRNEEKKRTRKTTLPQKRKTPCFLDPFSCLDLSRFFDK